MTVVPNLQAALVTVKDRSGNVIGSGYVVPPWNSFFQQFTQAPEPIEVVTPTGSGFTYEASVPGTMYVSGGTGVGVFLTRGAAFFGFGISSAASVVLSKGDIFSISYTTPPQLRFVPN